MQSEIRTDGQLGRILWLSDGKTEVGVALDFGIRIMHLSCVGMENLFYRQPADLSDGLARKNGWRLYGGHRLWMAPESNDSFEPDNQPVFYTLEENGVYLEQEPDTCLHIKKFLRIRFQPDGGIAVEQGMENLSDATMTGASWGINTLASGGKAEISFECNIPEGSNKYNPTRSISLWTDTDIYDPRLHFTKQSLEATFMPLDARLKVGLYANPGKAVFYNKDQKLTICFDVLPMEQHPDSGCNFELYMCKNFMELETLGAKTAMQPGESTSHTEVWYLDKQ